MERRDRAKRFSTCRHHCRISSYLPLFFFYYTLPLEVCFHLVSIPCNCARTMKRDTVNYSGSLPSSNFLGSENRLLSGGRGRGEGEGGGEREKDKGIEKNSRGNRIVAVNLHLLFAKSFCNSIMCMNLKKKKNLTHNKKITHR